MEGTSEVLTDSRPAVFVQGAVKRYRKFGEALRGVNLRVPRGSFYSLIGSNGAGKTTLLKVIAGLISLQEGRVEIFGTTPQEAVGKGMVGYLPEHPAFFPHQTAFQQLHFLSRLSPFGETPEVDDLLRLFDLHGVRDRKVKTFSEGMVQRLAIAQILLQDSELFLFDEPFRALDPPGRRALKDVLVEIRRRGKTVIMSSQDLDDVEELSTHILCLREGGVVMDKTLAEIDGEAPYEVEYREGTPPGGRTLSRIQGQEGLWRFLSELKEGGGELLSVRKSVRRNLEDLWR